MKSAIRSYAAPLAGLLRLTGVLLLLMRVLCGGALAATPPEIIALPATLEPTYDLSWTMQVTGRAAPPLEVLFEHSHRATGYRLSITPTAWRWESLRRPQRTAPAGGALALQPGQIYTLTVKRRPGEIALLVNQRLVGTAAAPAAPSGRLAMAAPPAWAHIEEVRYIPVGARQFGDDFMRPEVRERFLQHPDPWFEDTTWQVAHYRKAWPGDDPRDPASGQEMTIPWQLGVMLNTRVTPNGFWYLYTGVGPSWVVANAREVPPAWDRYFVEAAIKPEYNSGVGLIAAYQSNQQYLLFRWEQEAAAAGPRAALYAIIDGHPQLLATARAGFTPRQWYTVRLCVDWRTVQVWIDGTPLLETPNPGLIAGRVGLFADGAVRPNIPEIDAATAGLYAALAADVDPSWSIQPIPCIYFDDVRVGDWEATARPAAAQAAGAQPLPEGLLLDAWSQTFTSAEALWTPAATSAVPVTPQGRPHDEIGAAAPFPTDQPGLYWQKGRHYHDLAVIVPLSGSQLAGQTLHCTQQDEAPGSYRLVLTQQRGQGRAQLFRQQIPVGLAVFDLRRGTQLILRRQGTLLQVLLAGEDERERVLLRYQDPHPLPFDTVGMAVTDPSLPAARVQVVSDWQQETFATAPTAWRTTGGVWGMMTRYACDPSWNWFGGYGAATPTAWTKAALLGDQTLEVYLGIKMEYDNLAHESAKRFRDLNLSICTDGLDPNSGYTLTRGHLVDGEPVTQLLRRGTVVWTSTHPADLMPTPTEGYRAWSALRLVKTGATVAVYLDNRLAGTFTDPAPLAGGYAAIWTINNGIVIGRVNYGAVTIVPASYADQERR